MVQICNYSYILGVIVHDLHAQLLNKGSSLKTICSNPAACF